MPEMSPSIKELAAALVAAQAELPTIAKDKDNPFFRSKYAGLEAVMPAALQVLSAHELGLIQTVGQDGQGGTTLTTILVHTSGEWLSDTQLLLLAKADSQGQGSAITYGRRYAVMSMLGLVAEEDDDGNAASPRPAPSRKPQAAPPQRGHPGREVLVSTAPTPPPTGGAVTIQPNQIKAIRASLAELFLKDEQAMVEWMQGVQPKAVTGTEIHLGELTDREASDIIGEANQERTKRRATQAGES